MSDLDLKAQIDALLEQDEKLQRILSEQKEAFGTAPPTPPDALVLCNIEVVCQACNERYQSPNPKLMLRYGTTYSAAKQLLPSYNALAKEAITRIEHSAACEQCFHKDEWRIREVSEKPNTVKR